MKHILMFDSGVGGLSVFDAICAAGLALEVHYVADNAWLPYGEKSDAAICDRVKTLLCAVRAVAPLELIVMACNTASTIALDVARAALAIPIVGVVPPVKPAAELTKTGTIGLLATPATVARAYTDDLIARFAADQRVIRFGSTSLVAAAEAALANQPMDRAAIDEAINGLFGATGGGEIDVVALACTHFPLLKAELAAAAPRACTWLDSGAAIARRVSGLLNVSAASGQVRPGRALFSAPARAPFEAFVRRGFADFGSIGPAPGFEVSPLSVGERSSHQ